jgi:2-dehydropantoate 2-reductase
MWGQLMRIAVIGAGVLGSLYAARLAAAGHVVTVVARGDRLTQLQRGPILILNEDNDARAAATVAVVANLEPDADYDLALVVVRADQIDALLPDLRDNRGVKTFLFLHNRAAGHAALAQAVGPERLLLGFPGAGGWLDGGMVRYRLIPEQPTTIGEPGGSLSPVLRQVAKALEQAGFTVALSRHMDDWLKTHAMLVTAIAGSIYLGHGSTAAVAQSRDSIRRLVRGIRQGFGLLSGAGVVITPRKLGLLVGLPAILAETYLRRFLARPASELIMARHANAVPGELATLVLELRAIVRLDPGAAPDLETLWAAVSAAANRGNLSSPTRKPAPIPANP